MSCMYQYIAHNNTHCVHEPLQTLIVVMAILGGYYSDMALSVVVWRVSLYILIKAPLELPVRVLTVTTAACNHNCRIILACL